MKKTIIAKTTNPPKTQPLSNKQTLQILLDKNYKLHNSQNAIHKNNISGLDPLLKVYTYKQSADIVYIALICALFSYGNVKAIIGFLDRLEECSDRFRILNDKTKILSTHFPPYRFQTSDDVKLLFLALNSLKYNASKISNPNKTKDLESIILFTYKKTNNVLVAIYNAIEAIYKAAMSSNNVRANNGIIDSANSIDLASSADSSNSAYYVNLTGFGNSANFSKSAKKNPANTNTPFSAGFSFLIGSSRSNSPLKRWNMFMRWMVSSDNIDLGIWKNDINAQDLLLPLDTHTFRVCKNLGLLSRKSYDKKAVIEASENLRMFDRNDPIKYDFALYRIGQNEARNAKNKNKKTK